MKSAAFNLAFKVHRNEIPFAEGLLKSVEAEAQHDFIEALNSLAGESRYDARQLDELIQEARTSLLAPPPPSAPVINIQGLREDITGMDKKRRDLADSIHTLENRIAALHTTVVPGINSAMWGAVGLMMAMIVFLLDWFSAFLILLAASFLMIVMTYLMDSEKLKQELTAIQQKKTRVLGEIKEIKSQIEELDHQILEKQEQIDLALHSLPPDTTYSESQPV